MVFRLLVEREIVAAPYFQLASNFNDSDLNQSFDFGEDDEIQGREASGKVEALLEVVFAARVFLDLDVDGVDPAVQVALQSKRMIGAAVRVADLEK